MYYCGFNQVLICMVFFGGKLGTWISQGLVPVLWFSSAVGGTTTVIFKTYLCYTALWKRKNGARRNFVGEPAWPSLGMGRLYKLLTLKIFTFSLGPFIRFFKKNHVDFIICTIFGFQPTVRHTSEDEMKVGFCWIDNIKHNKGYICRLFFYAL